MSENIKKYKTILWFDTKAEKVFWGIDVQMQNGNVLPVQEGGKALFYNKKIDARTKVKELNNNISKQ